VPVTTCLKRYYLPMSSATPTAALLHCIERRAADDGEFQGWNQIHWCEMPTAPVTNADKSKSQPESKVLMILLAVVQIVEGILGLRDRKDVPFAVLLLSVGFAILVTLIFHQFRRVKVVVLGAIPVVCLCCGVGEFIAGNKIEGTLAVSLAALVVFLFILLSRRPTKLSQSSKADSAA